MLDHVNQLIIMTDEHTRKVLGCYGNKFVETPNLDELAEKGTRFENAYTNVPICVPARASFATGHYAHYTNHWDNATPYIGEPKSWAHELQSSGVTVGSIGKLHYRNSNDPVGLDFQEIPMHIVNGIGDILGCVREPLPKRWKARKMAEEIGPGESNYNLYDKKICEKSISWLKAHGHDHKPWALFVSFVAPHFPLIAPQEFYDLYSEIGLMPKKLKPEPEHPWHFSMRSCQVMDNFTEERTKIALASYYALVSFIDNLIGKIINQIDQLGIRDNTQVIYVSDHGDNIGERDFWGKSNFFEESVGIPCIISGPKIPKGKTCLTPVSLVDIHPTILQTANIEKHLDKPGRSLIDLANSDDNPNRVVFSEYHAHGAKSGSFMIRQGFWKYMYYVGMQPQLFNLQSDPDELFDLGQDLDYAEVRSDLEKTLQKICDPEKINERAMSDQRKIVEKHGGREMVVERGSFGATPPPGIEAKFVNE